MRCVHALARRGLLGLAATAAAGPALASDHAFDQLRAAGRLRAGIDFDDTPMAFRTASGAADGLAVAVAALLARGMGLDLEIVSVSKLDGDVAVQAGRIDLLVSAPPVSIALARELMVADPYASFHRKLITRRSLAISRVEDLDGFNIVTLPQRWPAGLEESSRRLRANFLRVADAAAIEQALLSGTADAAILPDYMASRILERRAGLEEKLDLGQAWIGAALPYGQHTLLRVINSLLYLARRDGQLAILHRGFLDRPMAMVPFF
jgi:polar amino acid transport system substrate-binding protein